MVDRVHRSSDRVRSVRNSDWSLWLGASVAIVLPALWIAGLTPAAGQESEATFITRQECADCHDEAETFVASPHGQAMLHASPEALDASCVGCHGSGVEHIEDPMPENINKQPGASACATCHVAKPGELWLATDGHTRFEVACLDCHGGAGHTDLDTPWLLTEEPFELCGSCHATQAAASHRPFAHRDGKDAFACTECHSPHGVRRVGRLTLLRSGGPCINCHTEKAAPFIYPHPPREVDGCVACHEPHGSTNPRLLTRRQVLNLCLECHTNVPSFHNVARARYRVCTNCHVAVHGSNRDRNLFDE